MEMRISLIASLLVLLAACGGSTPQSNVAEVDTTPSPDESKPMFTTGAATRDTPDDPPPGSGNSSEVCEGRPEFGPATLDAAEAGRRRGANAKTFSEVPSTKDKPIEVCGIEGEQVWLMSLTCADGSKAFDNRDAVRKARAGNVGGGGLCDSIIDRYVATCPEATYDVFLDMYMCGPGESFM